MVIYLIDTNVLLRLAERNHPLYPTIRASMRGLRERDHELRIGSQNCIEFWNVATRPVKKNGFGLTPARTEKILRLIERLSSVILDTPTIYYEWRKLVVKFQVSGVQVHDACLVAAMKANKITHILTFNTSDFTRYKDEGVIAVSPSEISSSTDS